MMVNFKKKTVIIIYTIFSFFISFVICFAQEKKAETINNERQEKIYFQGFQNNHLIFYNSKNKLYYLLYRKDKWDYDNDELVKNLIQGNEYLVSFLYISDVENIGKTSNTATQSRVIRNKDTILTGIYKKHSSVMDSLRGL